MLLGGAEIGLVEDIPRCGGLPSGLRCPSLQRVAWLARGRSRRSRRELNADSIVSIAKMDNPSA